MSINLCDDCFKQYTQSQLNEVITLKQELTCYHIYKKMKTKMKK